MSRIQLPIVCFIPDDSRVIPLMTTRQQQRSVVLAEEARTQASLYGAESDKSYADLPQAAVALLETARQADAERQADEKIRELHKANLRTLVFSVRRPKATDGDEITESFRDVDGNLRYDRAKLRKVAYERLDPEPVAGWPLPGWEDEELPPEVVQTLRDECYDLIFGGLSEERFFHSMSPPPTSSSDTP
jgi:hypothetical protein